MNFIHWRQIYNINIHLRNFAEFAVEYGLIFGSSEFAAEYGLIFGSLEFTAEYGLIFGSYGFYCQIWIDIRQLWILLPNMD